MLHLTKDILYTIVQWLPKKLVYFCAMEVLHHATTGEYSSDVDEIRAITALRRYNKDFGVDQ